jgi:hypothetical protein
VIQNFYRHGEYTVIATEADSRYTLLMPFAVAPSLAEFENELLRRWGNELAHLTAESKSLDEPRIQTMIKQFIPHPKSFTWYRNTDMSIRGHISDAEQWVTQTLQEHGLQRLSDNDALELGDHINKLRKRAKQDRSGRKGFYPVVRLLDDGLYRFAKGLSGADFPNTPPDDFPNPYMAMTTAKTQVAKALPDNVVCLASFRNRSR